MNMKVPFAFPECGQEEIDEVIQVIQSGWLTTASRCLRFEKEFAAFIGAKHALAVNSATAALHLGLEALGIREGDQVLVPTLTFTATAEVVRYLGAEPLWVDCDQETFCIPCAQVEQTIERSQIPVKAIMPVHFGGHPCDMDNIINGAREDDLYFELAS